MIDFIRNWYERYFVEEEAVLLLLLTLLGSVFLFFLGGYLMPVLASLVIAYLLQGIVNVLVRWGVPPLLSILGVFTLFIGFFAVTLIWLLPLLTEQIINLQHEFPGIIKKLQSNILLLPNKYPELISLHQIQQIIDMSSVEMAKIGQKVLSFSFLQGVFQVIIYAVLIPVLVFFFLKDRVVLTRMLLNRLPKKRFLLTQIWNEMNQQMSNYIRGKAFEIIIVGVVSAIVFLLLGLKYAALLGLLVGLSVIIPYIGAAVVTIPVLLMGFVQWGWSDQFLWLFISYMVIQIIDGNVLVPLLFSEAVNLHPVVIIASVLVFGGIWGFWGVFFAIPLATLVKAIFNAWPSRDLILKLESQ